MGLRTRVRRTARRMMMPEDARIARVAVETYDLLAETPLHGRYWLCGGLLMGYLRHGGPIPGDTDIDFKYYDTDRGALELGLQALVHAGYKKRYRWVNNDGRVTEWSLEHRGVKVDFFEASRQENRMQWYSYITKPRRELLNETPAHGLSEMELFDRLWLKPDDHETFLSSIYGDWRVPQTDYCYWMDSGAIISRTPWRGDNAW